MDAIVGSATAVTLGVLGGAAGVGSAAAVTLGDPGGAVVATTGSWGAAGAVAGGATLPAVGAGTAGLSCVATGSNGSAGAVGGYRGLYELGTRVVDDRSTRSDVMLDSERKTGKKKTGENERR